MLESFVRICNALNLKYYVTDGTLLGAVRHGGFIPWDDDIDVSMPRKDYEIFLNSAPGLLPKSFFLQNYRTDLEYTNSYSKLRDCETTFLETLYADRHINHGIYIDIFPLDYLPDNRVKRDWILWKNYIQHLRLNLFLNWQQTRHPFVRKIMKTLLRFIYPRAKNTLEDNCRMRSAIKPQKKMICYSWCGLHGRGTVPTEYFGNGVHGVFEGIDVIFPQKYKEYLTLCYGDYMSLPPEEKRVSHHSTLVIDTEKSYLSYNSLICTKSH